MVTELETATQEKIEILEATIEELATKVEELITEKTELATKVETLVTEKERTVEDLLLENEELEQEARESRRSFTSLNLALSALIFIYGMIYGSYLCPK